MFDYETLRFIWWLLIGVILVVFMISDGFDMGIGCLLPLVAHYLPPGPECMQRRFPAFMWR